MNEMINIYGTAILFLFYLDNLSQFEILYNRFSWYTYYESNCSIFTYL